MTRRSAEAPPADKPCVRCGRTITWRKAWARTWESVKYCGEACRRTRLGPTDRALEEAIRALLRARAVNSTICPSEAARAVAGEGPDEPWRLLMEPARMAARRLVVAGEIEITQGGRVVDPSTAKGPIRLRTKR